MPIYKKLLLVIEVLRPAKRNINSLRINKKNLIFYYTCDIITSSDINKYKIVLMKRRNFLSNIALFTGSSTLFNLNALWKDAVDKNDLNEKKINSRDTKEITGIQVTAPSAVVLNETFWVGIRILTEPFYTKWKVWWQRTRATVDGPYNQSPRGTRYMENVLPAWDGSVDIKGSEGYKGLSSYSFSKGAGPYEYDNRPVRRLEGFRFTSPGTKYIRVVDPVSGIEGISNPIHVEQ